MDRAPAPVANFVRGKSGYVPFRPGGLDDVILAANQTTEEPIKRLRIVPPGFSRGLRLPGDDVEEEALVSLDGAIDTKEDEVYLLSACVVSTIHKDLHSTLMKIIWWMKKEISYPIAIVLGKLMSYCRRR